MTPHWATTLIGKPYVIGGEGPDKFDCWGLVRWCFINQFGIDMPRITIGGPTAADRAKAIREVEDASGWRPCADSRPGDRDILLMYGPSGRHVALALAVNGGVHVLHCIEEVGVTLTSFSEMWFLGFKDITIWRKA